MSKEVKENEDSLTVENIGERDIGISHDALVEAQLGSLAEALKPWPVIKENLRTFIVILAVQVSPLIPINPTCEQGSLTDSTVCVDRPTVLSSVLNTSFSVLSLVSRHSAAPWDTMIQPPIRMLWLRARYHYGPVSLV